MKIGFIGQGWIGKNYALDFEERGFDVVRYGKEPEYAGNKEKITECGIVFIAVPTPTTPKGFDVSIVEEVLSLIGPGKIAVIKSSLLPGTTEALQKLYPNIFVVHSPEFLTEVNARHDASHPLRNIIGIPIDTEIFRQKAKEVLDILPNSSYNKIMPSTSAELIKYASNNLMYVKVVFVNMLYDMAVTFDQNWDTIKEALLADLRLGNSHFDPIHKYGRGAGGHCFIKDFAAFENTYESLISDPKGKMMLKAIEDKNIDLLLSTQKDLDLLIGVYGEEIMQK